MTHYTRNMDTAEAKNRTVNNTKSKNVNKKKKNSKILGHRPRTMTNTTQNRSRTI